MSRGRWPDYDQAIRGNLAAWDWVVETVGHQFFVMRRDTRDISINLGICEAFVLQALQSFKARRERAA